MRRRECIAMILAGGKGARLGALTNNVAKPTVYFGDRYRLIDFTLSNCVHSGINTVGVLAQYSPLGLHNYISDGDTWRLNESGGGVSLLSPSCGRLYTGTANAVYQNLSFIERFSCEYVLILPGNLVYAMDYGKMLDFMRNTGADAAVAVAPAPAGEAPGLGAATARQNGEVTAYEPAEGGRVPGALASMGIFIFKRSVLKRRLKADKFNGHSYNDLGRDIIPAMLAARDKLYAFRFDGYWKDVGTVRSLWESNMDLLGSASGLDPRDMGWEIYTKPARHPSGCISGKASIEKSIVADGCDIYGRVERSVLAESVTVSAGAQVVDSVIMPGARVGRNAKIYRAIIGADAMIGENAEIGADGGLQVFVDNWVCSNDISLIGPGVCVNKNVKIAKNSHIDRSLLPEKQRAMVVNRENSEFKLAYV